MQTPDSQESGVFFCVMAILLSRPTPSAARFDLLVCRRGAEGVAPYIWCK